MKTIKSSEIGTFIFCQRAWSYQKGGGRSINTEQMNAGSLVHRQHTSAVRLSGFIRNSAYVMFLTSLTLALIFISASFN